jgi:hypothetical protein
VVIRPAAETPWAPRPGAEDDEQGRDEGGTPITRGQRRT